MSTLKQSTRLTQILDIFHWQQFEGSTSSIELGKDHDTYLVMARSLKTTVK